MFISSPPQLWFVHAQPILFETASAPRVASTQAAILLGSRFDGKTVAIF
jgi:hypothetical protein